VPSGGPPTSEIRTSPRPLAHSWRKPGSTPTLPFLALGAILPPTTQSATVLALVIDEQQQRTASGLAADPGMTLAIRIFGRMAAAPPTTGPSNSGPTGVLPVVPRIEGLRRGMNGAKWGIATAKPGLKIAVFSIRSFFASRRTGPPCTTRRRDRAGYHGYGPLCNLSLQKSREVERRYQQPRKRAR
jgi:hypothetical protein